MIQRYKLSIQHVYFSNLYAIFYVFLMKQRIFQLNLLSYSLTKSLKIQAFFWDSWSKELFFLILSYHPYHYREIF